MTLFSEPLALALACLAVVIAGLAMVVTRQIARAGGHRTAAPARRCQHAGRVRVIRTLAAARCSTIIYGLMVALGVKLLWDGVA